MAEGPSNDGDRQNPQLVATLLEFYDEFVELQDLNAFFCEAAAALAERDMELDKAVIEGLRTFSGDAQESANGLKKKLRGIIDRC